MELSVAENVHGMFPWRGAGFVRTLIVNLSIF